MTLLLIDHSTVHAVVVVSSNSSVTFVRRKKTKSTICQLKKQIQQCFSVLSGINLIFIIFQPGWYICIQIVNVPKQFTGKLQRLAPTHTGKCYITVTVIL